MNECREDPQEKRQVKMKAIGGLTRGTRIHKMAVQTKHVLMSSSKIILLMNVLEMDVSADYQEANPQKILPRIFSLNNSENFSRACLGVTLHLHIY